MKTIKYILYITIISICNMGCAKDWLNKKPELSATIPATLQDCQALMDNSAVLGAGFCGLHELAADGLYFANTNVQLYLTGYLLNAYTWTKKASYTGVIEWNQAYLAIYYCNLVLETLNKIDRTSNNAAEWDNVKGQALFQRSRAFFELVQTFAPPYLAETAAAEPGIPLRLSSDISLATKRTSLEQTYEQVKNDLMLSKSILPVTPLNKLRASKPAALGLLARMYLSMEKYSEAWENADSCLYYYPKLLNYYQLNQAASRPFIKYNEETILYAITQGYGAVFSARFNIPDPVYQLYADNDLRKTLFFTKNAGTGLINFKGFYTGSNSQLNGITSDEMYLVRAECYARLGNTTSALKDLNDLLKTRWKNTVTYPMITAANSEEALAIILLERKKELLLRGVRWSDLRRLNRDSRFVTIITHTAQGQTYTLEPNSYKYTFPIPDDVVIATGIHQNIGWEE